MHFTKIAWKIGYGNFTHFAGELRFDLPPAQRKVIEQDHNRMNGEWMIEFDLSKGITQARNMIREEWRLPIGKRDGEEIATAWNTIEPVSNHEGKHKMGFASALPILRVLTRSVRTKLYFWRSTHHVYI